MTDRFDHNSTSATHRNFRWIDRTDDDSAHAEFIETAYDVTSGIYTCLEIIYASDLERAANNDADPGTEAAPAIGAEETDKLMRLSIATLALLRKEASHRIEAANRKK